MKAALTILGGLLIPTALAFGVCGTQSKDKKWADRWLVLAYILLGVVMLIAVICYN